MDGLELSVCERSLRYGGQRVIVAEPAQILHEAGDKFWRRRNEGS